MEESQPTSGKRSHHKIWLALAFVNIIAGLGILLWAVWLLIWPMLPIFFSYPSATTNLTSLHKIFVISCFIPAILVALIPGILTITGGTRALFRSGRGFLWASYGWILLWPPAFGKYLGISSFFLVIPLPMSVCLVVALILGIVDFLLYRRVQTRTPWRTGKIVLTLLVVVQLLIVFGGQRVGTLAAISALENDNKDARRVLNARIADGVSPYLENWVGVEVEQVNVGNYVVSIPSNLYTAAKAEETSQSTSSAWSDGELKIVLTIHDKLDDKSILTRAFLNATPVNRSLFPDATTPFERYKLIRNTTPRDFSLWAAQDKQGRLLLYLFCKLLVPALGEPFDDGFHEIKTKCLRGISSRMKTPFAVELVDNTGQIITFAVYSETSVANMQLTAGQEWFIKNVIASIRPKTPEDSIPEALRH